MTSAGLGGHPKTFWDHLGATCVLAQKHSYLNGQGQEVCGRLFSMHFLQTLCIQKMFLRVLANFWYNLERHTTLTDDPKAGETHFLGF